MKMQKMKGFEGGGPSSSIWIMRVFDTDMCVTNLSPEFVAGLVLAFVVVLIAIQFFT